MAEQDIEIRFRSTRQGSGGEEQIDELDDLRERIDKLHQETKEITDGFDDMGDASGRASGKLDDLISIEKAQVAAQIAEVVNRLSGALQSMAAELEAVDPEAADKLNDVGLAVQSLGMGAELAAKGFAVGGPMGAALGGFIGLATGPVKGAFQDMMDDLKGAKIATDNAAKAQETLNRFLRERSDAARRSSLEGMFQRELEDIDAVSAAIERNIRLLETRRQVDEAVAGERLRQAELAGADPQALGRAGAQAEVDARIAELQAGIESANRRADLAQAKADSLSAKATSLATNQADGFTDEQIKQAEQAANQALIAAENARAEANLAAEQAAATASQILAEATTRIAEESSGAGDRITEAGQQAIEVFNQAESQLGELSTNAQTFRDRLQAILADAIPDEQQADQIRGIIDGLRTTQEARDSAIFESLSTVRESVDTQQQLFRSLQRDLQRQQEQINALR